MTQKLLIVVPGFIPTVEIIVRTLKHLSPRYQIKTVLATHLKLEELFSGEYKVLFIRMCDPAFKPIIDIIQASKASYLYYLDDNFWELGKGANKVLAQCYSNPDLLEALNLFVQHAHQVLAGSENLKNYIQPYTKNVSAINAAFDFKLLDGLSPSARTNQVKILYSGSLHREQDFAVIIPALKRILVDYSENVTLHFNGFVPDELKSLNNVIYDEHFYEYDEYIKKQYTIGYDIGLAPLHDSPSNRAKSNLKYREYGACHIAGIYSDIPPYSDCITSYENGILVHHHTEAWYNALKELVENITLRQKIARNAFQDVKLNYTHEKIAADWESILATLPVFYVKRKVTFLFKLKQYNYALRYKLRRVKDYYQYHGLIFTSKKIVRTLWLILQHSPIFLKNEK